MRTDDKRLAEGMYASKQLFGGFSLLAWSHRRRFDVALELARPMAGRRMLDYGAGDGTLLAMAHDEFPDAIGLEVDPGLVGDCSERFAHLTGLRFMHADLADTLPAASFGVVICTEVLEHCPDDAVGVALARMRRLVAPDGRVIISVPVEIGLPLAIKQAARVIAARRVHSDYKNRETYAFGEFLRMLTATTNTAIPRPTYQTEFTPGVPNRYHGHKGFNWRSMRARIRTVFRIAETRFSPISWLGPQLASQAWFVCRAS
jgi:2-polyprenyl-3-methyl-5-hydroxy-6-metoxy-1,4-benzoquinol methylase